MFAVQKQSSVRSGRFGAQTQKMWATGVGTKGKTKRCAQKHKQ